MPKETFKSSSLIAVNKVIIKDKEFGWFRVQRKDLALLIGKKIKVTIEEATELDLRINKVGSKAIRVSDVLVDVDDGGDYDEFE